MKSKLYLLTASLISLLFFSSCSDNSTDNPQNAGQLIPTKIGNNWTYEDSSYVSGKTVYDTVTGKITGNRQDTINGKVVTIYTQCEFHNGQPTKEIFISNEADGLYSYGNDSDTSNLIYSGMIAKYPSSVGEQWTCGYFVFYFSNGKFQTYISNGVLINPNDTFTTPLQKFNCISYQYRTQLEVLTEYYCPGIGYLGYYDVYDGKFFGKRMLIDYKLN